MVNQPIGSHGLEMFLFGWFCPWTPSSRSYEDTAFVVFL